MIPMKLSDSAILNIKGSDYRCIISLISKNEAITLLQNAGFDGKKRNIINLKNIKFFETIYKNGKSSYKIW